MKRRNVPLWGLPWPLRDAVAVIVVTLTRVTPL
jgi:hypothetical protein